MAANAKQTLQRIGLQLDTLRDPLQYFADYPRRFSLCHVKDMAADGSITDVGRGEIDYARILAAARSAGIQHYFVEHDHPRNPLQSVQFSYRTLAQLAF